MDFLKSIKLAICSEQTPIEVALCIDEYGKISAKKLYEFLGLEKAHYVRWCKENIIDNSFAEENVDFWAFVVNEWNGQSTMDYKLTISFAKKLAMSSYTKRGEQARKYFIKVEEWLKQQALNEKQKVANYI